jgi:DNA excision repair protein ERCC-2
VFLEQRNMSQTDKHDFLERFKRYKDVGAVILGVVSGNYSEGIDLPGDLLKGVVIVGLPLQQPNLETKELIKYFDDKFQRGWAYGYIFPAFNKTLQSAGRCIRSEEDKGVVIFLEERYLWPMYKGCFPRDQEYTVTKEPAEHIEEFFS